MTRIFSVIACMAVCMLMVAETRGEIPPVHLSSAHRALCKVGVGDSFPPLELPALDGTAPTSLAERLGGRATVVVFWKGDGAMTRMALGDLQRDVSSQLGDQGVAVVAIAVEQSPESARTTLEDLGVQYTNLLDEEGAAFARVGTERLPRIYLLDSQGKILWFDIEYSLATRRELAQALQTVLGTNG